MAGRLVALLPMKGHSERIPNKNMKLFNGKPLCFWILDTLTQVSEIKKIVINTDSDELAKLVLSKFDVTIHKRPNEICGDFVAMNKIIEHDLKILSDETHFLQTHSTNPLLTVATLKKAIATYFENDAKHDSLFSVTRHQSRFYDKSGKPVNHNPNELMRTQDLPPLYEENSNFYLFSQNSFKKTDHRIGKTPSMFEVNPLEAIDLDEPYQWKLAESLVNSKF